MYHHSYRRFIRLLYSSLLLFTLSTILISPTAEANYFTDLYQGIQQFSELPSEVNQLQESYQETVKELENTKDQLDETIDDMETYRTQNAALMEQNRQLTQVVDQLKDDRAIRESYLQKIKITLYTALCLIIGYFIIIRLIRFSMRYRSNRGDRFH